MSPDSIASARKLAGLSVAGAARLVHVSERNWRRWESGDKPMPEAAWELFCIKAGLKVSGSA
jgi:DNA-binding transcriptional regulator YiaG